MIWIAKYIYTLDHRHCFVWIEIDMLIKDQFPVKNESQILPQFLEMKDGSSNERKIKGKRIENPLEPSKMKDFSFWMFNYKSEFWKKDRYYIVTIKETRIGNWKWFALW